MSKIDEYVGRVPTQTDRAELDKILALKNELASQNKVLSLRDYSLRRAPSSDYTMEDICNRMGLTSQVGVDIFNIVRSIKPQMCLELGTGIGISGSYIAAALKLNNNNGKLITIEADTILANLSRDVFYSLDLDNVKVVNAHFINALPTIMQISDNIDLAFCDGNDNEQRTFEYYQFILNGMRDGAAYILGDIEHSTVWEKICNRREVSEYKDMNRIGVCLIGRWKSRGRIGID